MLNETQRAELRAKIDSLLKRLERDIADLQEATKPIPPDGAYGRLSRLDAMNNRAVNVAMLEKSQARQKALRKALHELEGPDFGTCQRCGDGIEFQRLRVMPEASVCMACMKQANAR